MTKSDLGLVTLTNDFHGTEVNLKPHSGRNGYYLSPRQVKRAKNALCGMLNCSCSGPLGERGQQPKPDPDNPYIIFRYQENPDGSCEVWFEDRR